MAWFFVLVLPFMLFAGAYTAVSERMDRRKNRAKIIKIKDRAA
jgi:hypothetical protein